MEGSQRVKHLVAARLDPERAMREIADDVRVGVNAETRTVSDLASAGVLDATKVVVRGLQIAFSNARTVLQTGILDCRASISTNCN